MTRRRWIADEVSDKQAALIDDHADHLVRVLRARVGQDFDIVTGAVVRRGRIIAIAPTRVEFELLEEVPSARNSEIVLLLSIFKFDRMEWAIEKCTELGVSEILPVIARRTDSHLAAASLKRLERWRKIALQAAEQSRRVSPPQIESPTKLAQAIGQKAGLRIVLDESEHQSQLRDALHSIKDKVVLAIGPEGGWADDETKLFLQAGWFPATLGETILRAETAAIAATVLAVSSRSPLLHERKAGENQV